MSTTGSQVLKALKMLFSLPEKLVNSVGGLRLHKFVSNDRNVVESIPPSERATNVKNMDLAFDDLPLERALGIQWDVKSDHFRLNVSLKHQPATRRDILSTVASPYDPLRFVAPQGKDHSSGDV